jgi:hypothetical protein
MSVDLSFTEEEAEVKTSRRAAAIHRSAVRPVTRLLAARLMAEPGRTESDRLVACKLIFSRKAQYQLHKVHGLDVTQKPQYTMWSEYTDNGVCLLVDHSGGDRLGYVHRGIGHKLAFVYEIGDSRRLQFALFAKERITVPCYLTVVNQRVPNTNHARPLLRFTPMWDMIPHNYEFYD